MLVLMLSTTVASIAVWKKIGARGRQLHLGNSLWLTTLLWLMLPAHLLQGATSGYRFELWPIPAAASMLLVTLMWLLGGVGSGRIHPVLAAYLLLVVACDQNLTPYSVLQRNKVGLGDIVLTAPPVPINAYMKEGYLKSALIPGADALELEPASSRLLAFTSGQRRPGRSWLSLESLLRDEMPPLEDLMIGGQPGPIGSGCGVAVIIGGLFLLYRGIIDFRVPLSLLVGAVIAFLALPIPVIIKDPGDVTTPSALVSAKKLEGIEWRWFAMREKQVLDVGPAKAITDHLCQLRTDVRADAADDVLPRDQPIASPDGQAGAGHLWSARRYHGGRAATLYVYFLWPLSGFAGGQPDYAIAGAPFSSASAGLMSAHH